MEISSPGDRPFKTMRDYDRNLNKIIFVKLYESFEDNKEFVGKLINNEDDQITLLVNNKEINLTAKEFDLLELLVFNPNKVYSRENLLYIVWGYEYPGDIRTVDVHIRRLREKIEANPSEPRFVHTKWGVGYYFRA